LIRSWQQGNEQAFEQLYAAHAIELLTIAMQKTNDREIAKELVQTVFVTFFQNKATAHNIHSLKAYLYTILKNKLLDHYRHLLVQKKHKFYTGQLYVATESNNVYTYVDTRELELLLQEEIQKLPPQCKHVFRLRREAELSNKEIAHQLNISENTVEQHMRRALRLLRNALQAAHRMLFTLLP
jgi:RNA polymerase sigma-70 factor (family 1)